MSLFNYGDDEELGDNWDGPITGRNCFVLLIDASRQMFSSIDQENVTFFQKSMAACKEILLGIARKQKMDLTAIVLYGTRKSEGKHAPSNVVLYQPLSAVTVTKIKQLLSLLDGKCETIAKDYGHSDKFRLSDALQYCQTIIRDSRCKVYVKNIIMFTCNDDPHKGDPTLQHQARKQAEELLGHNVELDVVGLGNFDSTCFFKELVLMSRGELLKDWVNCDPILDVNKLLSQIDRVTEKYSQRRSNMWLSSKCSLQVALYKLYNEPRKFRTEKLSDSDVSIVRSTSKMDGEDDEMIGEPDEIPKFNDEANVLNFDQDISREQLLLVGNRTIPMTRNELKQVEIPWVKVGINIAGFVDTAAIPLYFFRGEPYFVIPASNHPNVRLIFAHLLRTCLSQGKAILSWFKLTKSSSPQYVVLHPSPGGEYADGKEHSEGFVMSKLSFTEDLMEPEEAKEEEIVASEKQMEAAEGIVKKLTIPYSVDRFSDAEVQYRSNMIEALALDYDNVEEVEDDTDADLEGIDQRLGHFSADFNDCEHLGPELKSSGGRAGSNSTQMTVIEIAEAVRNGMAHKLNVSQLKELLKNEGVRNLSAMNKSMLVSVANKRFCDQ